MTESDITHFRYSEKDRLQTIRADARCFSTRLNTLHARVAQFGDRQVPSSRTDGRRRPCLEAFPIRKDDEDNVLFMDSGSDRSRIQIQSLS